MVGVRGIPATVGGAERVVEELTRELTARGHEVTVYARRHYVQDQGPAAAGKVIVTPSLRGKHTEAITHTATALIDLVLHNRVDLVHLHSPGPALLSWLPALAGVPVVLTIHAADWLRGKWSAPAKAALRMGLSCGLRSARAITTVSASLAAELSQEFHRPVHYVPNGVRIVPPRDTGLVKQWGLESGRYALTVGRVVPEKRLDLLLKAWPGIEQSGGFRLAVAGDIQESDFARACRRQGGPGTVFLGPVYGDALLELYSNAALVILPSSLEGMSMVMLEAASFGRCILAADIPANRDVLGDSIVYFMGGDCVDLRGQILRLLADRETAGAMGRSARDVVQSSYSWAVAAARMEEIYIQAIRGQSMK
ncbi:MAG: glycosyltransferase family 4 protein [Phycisphaerae bacterium]